jgi:hypothetical protein
MIPRKKPIKINKWVKPLRTAYQAEGSAGLHPSVAKTNAKLRNNSKK